MPRVRSRRRHRRAPDRKGHTRGDLSAMNPPKIRGLKIVQEGSPTRWKATGEVEGIGWLEAWGTSLVDALTALQTCAAEMAREKGTAAEDS